MQSRSTWRSRVRAALLVAFVITLSACASFAPPDLNVVIPQPYDEFMSSANEAAKNGQTSESLALFERAAKADPSKKQPWLRISQIHFDERRYGSAITAAEEVLQRDNADVTAKSILAASGLRVTANALEQLRAVGELAGARDEAKALARTMRDALGESILPAPAPVQDAAPPRRPAPRPAARRPAAGQARTDAVVPGAHPAATDPASPKTRPPAAPPPAVKPAETDAKRNPFSALKG